MAEKKDKGGNKTQEQLQQITEELERGVREVFESDKYQEYLTVMSKFHQYSYRNSILIAMQKPEATLVAGFDAWKRKFGRYVKKGEKGISILAPIPVKEKKIQEKKDPDTGRTVTGIDGKPETEPTETIRMSYRVMKVFDVSQTLGKELPELEAPELCGDVNGYPLYVQALEETSPVPIHLEKIEGGAKGYYHQQEKRIGIQKGMSALHTLKTMIHEVSHATLHDKDLYKERDVPPSERKDRYVREVEAESIAYVVCKKLGLDTSHYSFTYISSWSSNKELPELKNSLDTIRSTASQLITAIEERVQQLQNRSMEQSKSLISKEEIDFLGSREDRFAIYQLAEGEDMRELRFQSLSALQEKGVQADKANYQFIYHGKLEENQTLDSLFEQFNFDHPEGFCGHSLSVSDVVLLRREGLVDAFYVDSSGFVEITFGLDQLRAYQVGSHYLEIQTTEGGYDYTFYDAACQELDGGILENSTITIQEAVKELTDDRYAAAAIKSFDPDTLFEKIEEVNALAKAENRSRTTEYQRVR